MDVEGGARRVFFEVVAREVGADLEEPSCGRETLVLGTRAVEAPFELIVRDVDGPATYTKRPLEKIEDIR